MNEDIEKQIENTLDKIRPFLQRDGGDVHYIGFKDGIVYVKMGGACDGCAYMDSDISAGVEIILMEEVPGVIQVKTSEIPDEIMRAYEEKELKLHEATVAK